MRTKLFDTSIHGAKSCHASTIEVDSQGDLWFACFAGSHEGHPDVSIWGAKQVKGNWEKPSVWFKLAPKEAHWNPVLFNSPNGMLLWFKTGPSPMNWFTFLSKYSGRDWGVPVPFCEGIGRGPVRSKPIILSNGVWLAPCSLETPRHLTDKPFAWPRIDWTAYVERSADGVLWEEPIRLPSAQRRQEGRARQFGVIQPTLWESEPGHVHAFLRSTHGKICRSDSVDYGKTWSSVEDTFLPNPNSGVDVLKLQNGVLVLAYNPCDGNWRTRTPLSVAFSTGDGRFWSDPIHVETDNASSFSYPSMTAIGDKVFMTYTSKRRSIDLVDFLVERRGSSAASVYIDGLSEKIVGLP